MRLPVVGAGRVADSVVGGAEDVQLASRVVEGELLGHGCPEAVRVFEERGGFAFYQPVRVAGGEPGQLVGLQREDGAASGAVAGMRHLVAQLRGQNITLRDAEFADFVGQLHGDWRIASVVICAVGVVGTVGVVVAAAAAGTREVHAGGEGEKNEGGEGVRGHGVLLSGER